MLKTWEVQACPRCGEALKHKDGFTWQDSDRIVREDVAAIDEWLATVEQQEGVKVKAVRPTELALPTPGGSRRRRPPSAESS